MKKIVCPLLVSLFLVVNVFATAKAGSRAPGFVAETADGELVRLKDFRGKIVVLEWCNYGCPFVAKFYGSGEMQRLQQKYTKRGVVWLAIMSSAPEKQGYYTQERLQKENSRQGSKASYVLRDPVGNIGVLYEAVTTPHMFVIDRHGVVAYSGAIDSIRSTAKGDISKAENYVVQALEALLSDRKVAVSSTTPYGCSIKYAN